MNKSFGQHIREERIKLSLTAETLAQACGVSRSFITLIESGKRMPGKRLLLKIAVALHKNTSEVLNWYLEDLSQKIRKDFE
jgi:transcriptional regulator with XRE-family HTH domain